MNDYLPMDLSRIERDISSAEVVCIYFPMLGKTWVLDLRASAEGPLVRLGPVARGREERLRRLRRLRPGLPAPTALAAIPWRRRVDSLVETGVFGSLVKRVASAGFARAVDECGVVLRELRQRERAELLAALRGDSYHTVWARKPRP